MAKSRKTSSNGKKRARVDIESAEARKFSGSDSEAFQTELLHQVAGALWVGSGKSEEQQIQAAKAAIEAIKNIGPRSELEGMLAAQMIATHKAAMECLRRAMIPDQT